MRYNKIKKIDTINSLRGINVSLWTQGCPHGCVGCFNFETHDSTKGEEFTEVEQELILKELDNNVKKNLSILGGEPLVSYNLEGVYNLCKYIKEKRPETIIIIWTGYLYEEVKDFNFNILDYIDYLIDGKFVLSLKKNLKLRGSSNQRVIDIKKTKANNFVTLLDC